MREHMSKHTRAGRPSAIRLLVLLFALALALAACAEVEEEPGSGEAATDDEEAAGDEEASSGDGAAGAAPEGYPERPIELTVVYPAGGGMDIAARTLAESAEEVTGHDFRVVNREGAGGLVGHTYLAQEAQPDGYEIGVIAVDFLVFDITLRDAEFGQDALSPLAYIAFEPIVQVVRSDSELADMSYEEILQQASDNPGDISIGTIPESTFDVFTTAVEEESGAEFNRVPYDGGQPGVTALLGGEIDVTNAFYGEVQSHIESGDLTPVVISDDQTYEALPDTPTTEEVGLDIPGQTFGAGRMIVVPSDMDEDFQEYLGDMFLEVLESDGAASRFEEACSPLNPAGREQAQEIYDTAFTELPAALDQ